VKTESHSDYSLVEERVEVRNRVCPGCLKDVPDCEASIRQVLYFREVDKHYTCHLFCLPGSHLLSVLPKASTARVVPLVELQPLLALPACHLLELRVSHPLLADPFITLSKKLPLYSRLPGLQGVLLFEGSRLLDANIIAIGMEEFRVALAVYDVVEPLTSCEFLVELGQVREGEVEVAHRLALLRLEVVRSQSRINSLIMEMNFKYPFPSRGVLVLLKRVVLQGYEDRSSSAGDSPLSQYGLSFEGSSGASLEEFFEKTEEDSLYEQVRGRVAHLSKSNQGSRNLQDILNKCSPKEFEAIFAEILDSLLDLVRDQYANYMLQVIFQRCTEEQRVKLLRGLDQHLLEVVLNKKATHCVQTLVGLTVSPREFTLLAQCLADEAGLVRACLNNNGTHFIQKCIHQLPLGNLLPVADILIEHFLEVACNSYGICVLKAIVTKSRGSPLFARLVELAARNLREIMSDVYGNYLVQHFLEVGGEVNCHLLTEAVLSIFPLCLQNRQSSAVLEKCSALYTSHFISKVKEIILEKDLFEELLNNRGIAILQRLVSENITDKFTV
jgi:hypothetical protein